MNKIKDTVNSKKQSTPFEKILGFLLLSIPIVLLYTMYYVKNKFKTYHKLIITMYIIFSLLIIFWIFVLTFMEQGSPIPIYLKIYKYIIGISNIIIWVYYFS